MYKKIFLAFTILITISFVVSENSGIKFGLDAYLFKYLSKIDFTKHFHNYSLLNDTGLYLEKKSFPSYKMHIFNTTVDSIKNPSHVDILPRSDSEGNKYLSILLKNIEINVITNFDIQVTSFSDNGRNTPINIIIGEVNGEFFFINGTVHFNRLEANLDKINIKFESFIFKTIYSIFSGLIVKKINNAVNGFKSQVELSINNFITSQMLIDVGLGIGLNMTNTDRPELMFYNRTSRNNNYAVLFEEKQKFLTSNSYRFDDNISSVITFGVHGSVYPNLYPDLKPDIPQAPYMEFFDHIFDNKINLLVSGYTINTLLYMIKQTGKISKIWTSEDTENVFNTTIDTDGLSKFIPQLKEKYPENKKVELKIGVGSKQNQPLLNIDSAGNTLNLNFGVDLNVYTSDDPFDFPVNELKLDISSHIYFQFITENNIVNVLMFNNLIDNIVAKVDNIGVDMNILNAQISELSNSAIEQYQEMFQGINVSDKLSGLTGLKFKEFFLNTDNGYLDLSIDIEN